MSIDVTFASRNAVFACQLTSMTANFVPFVSYIAAFVSYFAALHSLGATFAFSVGRFASRSAAFAFGFVAIAS